MEWRVPACGCADGGDVGGSGWPCFASFRWGRGGTRGRAGGSVGTSPVALVEPGGRRGGLARVQRPARPYRPLSRVVALPGTWEWTLSARCEAMARDADVVEWWCVPWALPLRYAATLQSPPPVCAVCCVARKRRGRGRCVSRPCCAVRRGPRRARGRGRMRMAVDTRERMLGPEMVWARWSEQCGGVRRPGRACCMIMAVLGPFL
mmetsp:Transcript_56959/g.149600  ORF Transcript_56959/g.149600 Transcript_56959/m.149600 type:complete len:206 (+) Transcript_56959:129-746(+)